MTIEDPRMLSDAANLISSGGNVGQVLSDKNGYVGSTLDDLSAVVSVDKWGKALGNVGKAATAYAIDFTAPKRSITMDGMVETPDGPKRVNSEISSFLARGEDYEVGSYTKMQDQLLNSVADLDIKYGPKTLTTIPLPGEDYSVDTKPVIKTVYDTVMLPEKIIDSGTESILSGAKLIGKQGDYTLAEHGVLDYLKATNQQAMYPDASGPKTTLGNQINAIQSIGEGGLILGMLTMPAGSGVSSSQKAVESGTRQSKANLPNPEPGSLNDLQTRSWYKEQLAKIPNKIDTSKSLEEQAQQAVLLRNEARSTARSAMQDQQTATQLDKTNPNKTFDQLVKENQAKGYQGSEAYKKIINSAQKSNKAVDSSLGL